MRDRKILLQGFDDIATLLRYLYLDEDHSVTVKNCIDVPLRFRLTEDLTFMIKNLNFPNVPEHRDVPTLSILLSMVDQLKEMPGEQYDFKTRWDEIKTLTSCNVGLNRINQIWRGSEE